MSGDYSRDSFDSLRDFAGVFLQQGRAVLDADWNEMVEIFERRIRAGTIDTIGRCVVPRETESGFQIRIAGGAGLEIGPGRLYLDGVLLENHGFANFDGQTPDRPDPVFDRGTDVENGGAGVLDELIAPPEGDFLPYDLQPYWPEPDDLPGEPGTHLAYVVRWQRELTPVKDPSLLEPAMGGIDTCTRWQSVWQVRMLANVGDGATCETPDEDLDGWITTKAPSTARLTTATIDIDDPEDPCLVPPTEGYTGIENQLYRVELHSVEPGVAPTHFKYSRENASVAAAIEGMTNPANSVTVTRIGRDDVLRFSAGDWVEITDDIREFNHHCGQMLRVASVNPETREIGFEPGVVVDGDLVPSGADGDTFSDRHTRMIRWDQSGIIRLATDNSQWDNLGAGGSNGLIQIPPDGTAVILESGITITFSTADGPGQFRDMDYWRFSARTAGTQIEELRTAPPEGIQRHYCRLAVVRFPASVLDCRVFWPPEFEGGEVHNCGCTVCVTAEEHNSGALTIQAAIDQVGSQGGTVCLEAGNYVLEDPVSISDRTAITLRGQGIGTVLFYRGSGGAIQVTGSVDVQLEEFSLLATPSDNDGSSRIVHGIASLNSALFAVRRVAVLLVSPAPSDSFDFGIALDGIQIAARVEECLVVAPHAIGSRSSYGLDEDGDLTFAGFAELRIDDNILFGGRVAMLFDRVAINIAMVEFSRNLVFSTGSGAVIRFAEIPAASTRFDSSTLIARRTALQTGCTDLRVQDCEITGGEELGDGILLGESLVPDLGADAQIIGNNIFDLAGIGIHIDGPHDAVLIKRNIVRRCDSGGISTEPDATIRHIAIDNNVVEDIAENGAAGDAGAILVGASDGGQIIGNAVRGVGQGGDNGQFFSGIAVQAAGSFAIESNGISGIGPDLAEAPAFAILIRPPYDGVIVSGNRIDGASVDNPNSASAWSAIHIGAAEPAIDDGVVLGNPVFVNAAALPRGTLRATAFVAVDDNLFSFGPRNFRVTALRGRENQIGLTSNQIRCGARLLRPLVQIADAGTQSVAFGQNQCSLTSGGGLPQVVLLTAQRISMPGNTIIHRSDSLSARLEAKAATVVGNITTNRILLNGGDIPAPFDALNIQS